MNKMVKVEKIGFKARIGSFLRKLHLLVLYFLICILALWGADSVTQLQEAQESITSLQQRGVVARCLNLAPKWHE